MTTFCLIGSWNRSYRSTNKKGVTNVSPQIANSLDAVAQPASIEKRWKPVPRVFDQTAGRNGGKRVLTDLRLHGYILTMDQSDAVITGIFSR
eukprot:1195539-Prorocentrum_minimum.AAC.10